MTKKLGNWHHLHNITLSNYHQVVSGWLLCKSCNICAIFSHWAAEPTVEYSGHCLPSAPHLTSPGPAITFPLLVSRSLVIFLTWHPVWWLLMWAGQCLTSITLVTDTMPHHHMQLTTRGQGTDTSYQDAVPIVFTLHQLIVVKCQYHDVKCV